MQMKYEECVLLQSMVLLRLQIKGHCNRFQPHRQEAILSVTATFAVPLNVLSYFVMKTCVWGALLCWLSHIQQCCCGCKTASGISMYKQAYKWSTIRLFIFILLTVNKAEQALTPSNKWRPTHANSAAVGNRGELFELRSILFRLHWS